MEYNVDCIRAVGFLSVKIKFPKNAACSRFGEEIIINIYVNMGSYLTGWGSTFL